MQKEEVFRVNGKVVEALPNNLFRVTIEGGKHTIIAYLCGKMRKNYIRVYPDNEVIVEISPYDLTKGRIIYRK